MRFLAGHAAAGVEHHRGVLLADHGGQRLGQAEARMEAEPREVRDEARLRTGHAKVRHHRKPEPAADRRAVNRADDRLLGAEQPHRLHVEVSDRRASPRPAAGRICRASSRRRNSRRRRTTCPARRARRRGTASFLSSASSASAIELISTMSKKLFGGRWISIVATWPDDLHADVFVLSHFAYPFESGARRAVVRHRAHGAGAIVHVGEQRKPASFSRSTQTAAGRV